MAFKTTASLDITSRLLPAMDLLGSRPPRLPLMSQLGVKHLTVWTKSVLGSTAANSFRELLWAQLHRLAAVSCLLLTPPEVWVESAKLFCVKKFQCRKCPRQGSPQSFVVRQREYFHSTIMRDWIRNLERLLFETKPSEKISHQTSFVGCTL